MLECHFSKPAKEQDRSAPGHWGNRIRQIIDEFVGKYGKQALAAPPAEGFNLLAWVMPFAAIGAGLAMIWLFIRRIRKPAPSPDAPVDPAALSRYQERIEADLTKLD